MNIEISGFIIPHNEEPYYTCADRYAFDANKKALAIADGVGGSLYPSFLSERITKDFVRNPSSIFDDKTNSMIKEYGQEFEEYYQARYNELSVEKQQIIDLKAEQTKASSCTFVGCYFENHKCKYYAIGDSYLFYIAKDGSMSKYSSMEGKEFDVFPEYFSTSGKHNGELISGCFPLQDGVLLMMTDALSDWFIQCYKDDKSILNKILKLSNHQEYKEFCNSEISSGRLHDDDCALIIAKIENVSNSNDIFITKHIDNIDNLSEMELMNLVQDKELENKRLSNACKQQTKQIDEKSKLLTKAQLEIESKNKQIQDKELENKRLSNTCEQQAKQIDEKSKLLTKAQLEIESKNKQILDLQKKYESPLVNPGVIHSSELDEIHKLEIKLDEIARAISQNEAETSLRLDVLQALEDLKRFIQDTYTVQNNLGVAKTTSQKTVGFKKKMTRFISDHSNVLFNCIIIVLLIVILLLKK